MINVTKEAYANPRKRHLLQGLQKKLLDMTRAQMPGTYQSNTPMDAPILSSAEARQLASARTDSKPASNPGVAASYLPQRDHVRDPRPGPIPGEPIYGQPTPALRDEPETAIFLHDVVDRQMDDVFHEVAAPGVDVGLESVRADASCRASAEDSMGASMGVLD
jgi:hypothetical protein